MNEKSYDLLSKVLDDVSDHVTLFLQLVIRHHWHHFVVILGQVEVAVLPLGQKVGHILENTNHKSAAAMK